MRLPPSIKFAWYGSGQKWDDARLQMVGFGVGGCLLWASGLKTPQEILDNPGWAAMAGAVCGVVGAGCAFVLRLCWYPIHAFVAARGGYWNVLRNDQGDRMWPAILMISGVLAFVVLFGGEPFGT